MTKDWRPKEKRLTKQKKIKKNVRHFVPQPTEALASPSLSSPSLSSSSSPVSSARSSSSQSSSSPSTTSSCSLTSSSSSTSSSRLSARKSADSSDLTKSRQQAALRNLHELLRANVEVSSDEEEAEQEQEAEYDEDFFENFQQLPDIRDITIDTEEIKPKDISGRKDQFVDPLKDLELYRPPPVVKQKTVEEAKTTAASKKSSTSESDSLKSQFDELVTTDDYSTGGTDTFDNEPKVFAKPEDLFDNLLEFNLESVEEEEDWGAAWDTVWERERAAEQLKRDALEFLDDLILKVVKIDRSVTAQLREKLDKRKLMIALAEKYEQFQLESQYLKLLQRNVVRHMKRKKSYSSLEPDDPTELAANKTRYRENRLRLEKQLTRESVTIKKCQTTKETLLKEYKEEEQKTANQIRAFEKLVRTTLARPTHHVNLLIERPLQDLAKCRKEVSDMRLQLMLKHQCYIDLKKKVHNLEDLGDGVTAKSYFHVLHEAKELEASIKERNFELKKLHASTQRNIHMLAHCKEKQDKLKSIMVQQHLKLNELQARRQDLRRHVHELTQRRLRIQTQLNDKRLRAGLLDKPLLLKDYDDTVERIKQQRENNANLRATMLAIEAKIKRFEKILADNRAKTMILY